MSREYIIEGPSRIVFAGEDDRPRVESVNTIITRVKCDYCEERTAHVVDPAPIGANYNCGDGWKIVCTRLSHMPFGLGGKDSYGTQDICPVCAQTEIPE